MLKVQCHNIFSPNFLSLLNYTEPMIDMLQHFHIFSYRSILKERFFVSVVLLTPESQNFRQFRLLTFYWLKKLGTRGHDEAPLDSAVSDETLQ